MNDTINLYEPYWILVWTNPNSALVPSGSSSQQLIPTSNFEAQQIELDLSKYEEIKIEYAAAVYDSSNPDDYYSLMYQDVEVGGMCYLLHWGLSYTGNNVTNNGKNPNVFSRTVAVLSDSIYIGASHVKDCGNNTAKSAQTTTTIPIRIWAR